MGHGESPSSPGGKGSAAPTDTAADDDDPFANLDETQLQNVISKQFGKRGDKMLAKHGVAALGKKKPGRTAASDIFGVPSTAATGG